MDSLAFRFGGHQVEVGRQEGDTDEQGHSHHAHDHHGFGSVGCLGWLEGLHPITNGFDSGQGGTTRCESPQDQPGDDETR